MYLEPQLPMVMMSIHEELARHQVRADGLPPWDEIVQPVRAPRRSSRQAELRRLQRVAGKPHQGKLFQQRAKVLARLGGLFVSVGQRLEQVGQVQAPCAEEPVGGRA